MTFEVVGLAAGNNTELLTLNRLQSSGPGTFGATRLRRHCPQTATAMMPMTEMATLPEVDQVMVALMGAVGLSSDAGSPASAGKQVALSNKEPIVMAGQRR